MSKNLKVEDESPPDVLPTNDKDEHLAFQDEIARIGKSARSKLKRKALNPILERWNAALVAFIDQKPTDEEVENSKSYSRSLKEKEPSDFIEYLPPEEPISLLSITEFSSRLETSSIRLKLVLPSKIFADKDYLNHRYSIKKYQYLLKMSKILKPIPGIESSWIGISRGDLRSPYLKVKQSTTSGTYLFEWIPVLQDTVFPYRRFLIKQNNLRGFMGPEGRLEPTPNYNMSLLRDITLVPNVKEIDAFYSALPSQTVVMDAIVLIKIWCKSHNLNAVDGFDILTWIVIVMRGIQNGQVSLDLLSSTMFYSILIYLKSSKSSKYSKQSEERWNFVRGPHELLPDDAKLNADDFEVIGMEFVVDVTGGYNLAWDVSSSWMKHLKASIKQTISVFASEKIASGKAIARNLFDVTLPLVAQFDSVIEIDISKETNTAVCDVPLFRSFIRRIDAVLTQGLLDRISLIRLIPDIDFVTKSNGSFSHGLPQSILLCIVYRKETAWRLVDKGPSSEDKKAAKAFRSFWKGRSELKKFQDGSICEAVMWNCGSGKKYEIIDRIVEHLLNTHFGLQPRSITTEIAGLFETVFGDLNSQSDDFQKLHEATEKLNEVLRGLQDVPLHIISVQDIDPSRRRTDVFIKPYHPLADDEGLLQSAVPRCIEPIDVLLGLETSGSWPVDSKAFEITKTAMYAQMSLSLKKSGYFTKASRECVDLFLHGFVFRLRFVTERDEKEGSPWVLKRKYHSYIKNCTDRHLAFPMTTKLLKRWASTHLFDFHIDECVFDLLSTMIFESTSSRYPVASPVSGFFRALHLIAEFDWVAMPLIVDNEKELSKKERRKIEVWFEIQRSKNSYQSMMICTPFDKSSSLTLAHPRKAVLSRLLHQARLSYQNWKKPLSEMFTEYSLAGFDVVLRLKKEVLPYSERALSSLDITRNESSSKCQYVLSLIPSSIAEKFPKPHLRNQLLVGFDPIKRLWKTLTDAFGYVSVFCCDRFGELVAIHWLPEMQTIMEHPNSNLNGFWVKVEKGYLADKKSILSEIKLMGEGIIDAIICKD